MIYLVRMVGTGTLSRCAECRKLIRWPEEARLYAETPSTPVVRIEHVEHPVQDGAEEYKA